MGCLFHQSCRQGFNHSNHSTVNNTPPAIQARGAAVNHHVRIRRSAFSHGCFVWPVAFWVTMRACRTAVSPNNAVRGQVHFQLTVLKVGSWPSTSHNIHPETKSATSLHQQRPLDALLNDHPVDVVPHFSCGSTITNCRFYRPSQGSGLDCGT